MKFDPFVALRRCVFGMRRVLQLRCPTLAGFTRGCRQTNKGKPTRNGGSKAAIGIRQTYRELEASCMSIRQRGFELRSTSDGLLTDQMKSDPFIPLCQWNFGTPRDSPRPCRMRVVPMFTSRPINARNRITNGGTQVLSGGKKTYRQWQGRQPHDHPRAPAFPQFVAE
jgi:hypothetical protein